jgi:fucose permease
MSSRRNIFIRTIATVTGDFAVGFTMALACTWLIQAAALGLFLSFLLWLLTLALSLAVSQFAVHPAVQFVLSDRKLDRVIDAMASLAQTAADLDIGVGSPVWRDLQHRARRFTAGFAK